MTFLPPSSSDHVQLPLACLAEQRADPVLAGPVAKCWRATWPACQTGPAACVAQESVGGLVGLLLVLSVSPQTLGQDGRSSSGQSESSVGEWLRAIGMERYEEGLIHNGWDDLEFLR